MSQQYHLILDNSEIINWAKNALKKSNRVVWYLQQIKINPQWHPCEPLKHYYAMNIEAINNFELQRKELFDVLEIFQELQKEYLSSVVDTVVPESSMDEVLLTLPDNYYWVNLHKPYCDREAKAMGHCGNMSGEATDKILSLRRKIIKGGENFWEPHLTFILSEKGCLGEMKGKQNNRPHPKYHQQILGLISQPWIKMIVGGGYLPETNFHISQLPESTYLEFLKKYPNKFAYNVLETIKNKNNVEYFKKFNFVNDAVPADMLFWVDSESVLAEIVIKSNSPRLSKMAMSRFTDANLLLKVAEEASEESLQYFTFSKVVVKDSEKLRKFYDIASKRDIRSIKLFVSDRIEDFPTLSEEFLKIELHQPIKEFTVIKKMIRRLTGSEERLERFPQLMEELTQGKLMLMRNIFSLMSQGQIIKMVKSNPEKYAYGLKHIRSSAAFRRILDENLSKKIENELIREICTREGVLKIIQGDYWGKDFANKMQISELQLHHVKGLLGHPKVVSKIGKENYKKMVNEIYGMLIPSEKKEHHFLLDPNAKMRGSLLRK